MKLLPQRLERGRVGKHVLFPPASRNTMLLLVITVVAAVFGLWHPAAAADDCHWDVRAADWESPDSWIGRAVPTAGSTTYIGNYGTARIRGMAEADRLYVGSRKNGTVEVGPGGSLTIARDLEIGLNTTTGHLDVNGGKVSVGSSLSLGSKDSIGTLRVFSGGEVEVNGDLSISQERGIGELSVNGGRVKADRITFGRRIADFADTPRGVLNITDGLVDVNSIQLGFLQPMGNAALFLDGGVLAIGYTDGFHGEQILRMNGGTIQAKGNSNDFLAGFRSKTLLLSVRGGTIDTNGFHVRLTSGFQGQGGLNIMSSRGTGVLNLQCPQQYTGFTYIGENALLRQEMNLPIDPQSNVGLDSGGAFDLAGYDSTINGLFGEEGSAVTNSSSKAVELTVGSASGSGLFAGDIIERKGKVSLTKAGKGEQFLAGNNAYSGGTKILDGVLSGTTDSLRGNIDNSGKLVFSQARDGTFKGKITGFGKVEINGRGGALCIDDLQKYRGGTVVKMGTLSLRVGLPQSSIHIHPNGVVNGGGKVEQTVFNNGTLHTHFAGTPTSFLAGTYRQGPNGVLVIPIMGDDSYGELWVLSDAQLDKGAVVIPQFRPGYFPSSNVEYDIVHVGGHLSGRFRDIKLPGVLQVQLQHNDKCVTMQITQEQFSGKTPAQKSVAKIFNEIVRNRGLATEHNSDLERLVWDLEFVPKKELGYYLDVVAPQQVAGIKDIIFSAANMHYMQINDRLARIRAGVHGTSLNGIRPSALQQHALNCRKDYGENQETNQTPSYASSPQWNTFATASGMFSSISGINGFPRQRAATGHFSAGGDCYLNERMSIGIFAGYQGVRSRQNGHTYNHSSHDSNGIKYGIYGTSSWNGFYVNAIIGGGHNDHTLRRAFGTANNQWAMRSFPWSGELASQLGVGYEFKLGRWMLGTNSSMQYTYLLVSSVEETGGTNLNVRSERQNVGSLVGTLGTTVAYLWDVATGYQIAPRLGLAWQHEFANYGEMIAAAFNNGNAINGKAYRFGYQGVKGNRNTAFATAGVSASLGKSVWCYAYYMPQLGTRITSHSVMLGVSYTF
ncbi:autotransporter family protein [Candidatus Xiphinematobacter sp. Idaho Grape]|uniref:autotransporter family protein n=1 Tax=Candidatus Xiphinematobacter sp. Idaho Grape TaxID=1704307 RepID=UPI000786361C|nr:autotransporter outer membrane beta-barrel domain-containing protein [Candidatus Xiphinematobacter sp. Idaho Grape]